MASGSRGCEICGAVDHVAASLALCHSCLKDPRAERVWRESHRRARQRLGLRGEIPGEGVPCNLCVNGCRIPDGERGYCGARCSTGGRVVSCVGERAVASAYLDPLPTNCVADWVCPGGTGSGYPEFSHSKGEERGHTNLAVFYGACTFDCLYCQNWHYRQMTASLSPLMGVEELAEMMDESTSCVCFFGGDPTPFIDHSLMVARRVREGRRIMRTCWETNGSVSSPWIESVAGIALESGGCVKVDIKAWDDRVHKALTGSSNRRTLKNVAKLAEMGRRRGDPSLLVVSTLMVPGYVDEEEVSGISRFLSELDIGIPYSLLAFHPSYMMSDLPVTSRAQAERCVGAAREAGLERVRVGNAWLLAD